jgi:two-component system sensor histidine kinase/response regulator
MVALMNKSATPADRILVVDDIPDNSFLLKVILEGEGYRVEVADSGCAALAQIKAKPPDLVLLDVMMPDMSGFEVTRQIRQNRQLPFIPILLITAHDQPKASEGFDVGADGFLRKPIESEELISRVHSILPPR